MTFWFINIEDEVSFIFWNKKKNKKNEKDNKKLNARIIHREKKRKKMIEFVSIIILENKIWLN